MATKIYEWAIGDWEERKELSYVPLDQKIGELEFDCDIRSGAVIGEVLPYMTEDTGEGVFFFRFSSNEKCAILRVREAE